MTNPDQRGHVSTSPVRVFISYSQESRAHNRRVLEFAQGLRLDGIDAHLDQFVNGSPPEGWVRWMQRQIEEADFVVIVCTERYKRRFDGRESQGRGLGANWEGLLLKQMLYEAGAINFKYVPVLFEGATADDIPLPLKSYTYFRLPEDTENLLRMLSGQSRVLPAALGPTKSFELESVRENDAVTLTTKERELPPPTKRVIVQEVFVTRGVPKHTLVETDVFRRLAGELLKPRIGLVVEGPSGIGKTVAVKRALGDTRVTTRQGWTERWIPVRASGAEAQIDALLTSPVSTLKGHIIVDDFHRLDDGTKRRFADYMKILADDDTVQAKITIIGIPRTRQSLVNEVPELAYGALFVGLPPAGERDLLTLIESGENALNVEFVQRDDLVQIARGSFAVAQYLCEQALQSAGVEETQVQRTPVVIVSDRLIAQVLELLRPQFHPPLQAFAMQDRDANVRGASLTLLQSLGQSDGGAVTIADIRARFPEFDDAFRVFATRVASHEFDANWPARWRDILYCNLSTGILALDDPKLHLYLRHLDWPTFWEDCGVLLSASSLHDEDEAVEAKPRPGVNSNAGVRGIVSSANASSPSRSVESGQVRLLHLSDLHFDEHRSWDSDPVLSRMCADIRAVREQRGAFDLVVITGDIAYSGRAPEYEIAKYWLTEILLPAANLLPSHLFIVPGNHDFDRRRYRGVTKLSHQALARDGSQSDVAAALEVDAGLPVLAGHQEFVQFLNAIRVSGIQWSYPWAGIPIEVRGISLHLACLSSAWLASGDNDRGKLALGLWQVNQVFRGSDDADVVIAMMHHPWDWMAEWDSSSRFEVLRTADIILRGHLHDAEAIQTRSHGRSNVIELAAGASYECSYGVQGYQVIEIGAVEGIVRVIPRTWDSGRRDWNADFNRFGAETVELLLPRGPITR